MMLLTASLIFFLNLTYQDRYEAYVRDIAPKYELREELVEAIIEHESGWEADAESAGGAIGLMQIVPKYQTKRIEKLCIEDIHEPYQNILLGCDYLAELIDRYGSETEALMVYNQGYKGAQLYESGTISKYATSVLDRANELDYEHHREEDSFVLYIGGQK